MIRLTDWACPIPTGNLLDNSIRLLEGIPDGLAREAPSVKPMEATEAWGRQLARGNMEARPGCRAAKVTEVAFRRVQRGTSSRPSAINRGRRTRRRLELLLQDLAALVEATAEGPLARVSRSRVNAARSIGGGFGGRSFGGGSSRSFGGGSAGRSIGGGGHSFGGGGGGGRRR